MSGTRSTNTKKEGLQNYLDNSNNSILSISHRSGYRALDPKLAKKNRIRNTELFQGEPMHPERLVGLLPTGH